MRISSGVDENAWEQIRSKVEAEHLTCARLWDEKERERK